MSKYPNAIDDDSTLPPVNDNLDDIGGEAINAVRDSVINIEQFVGTGVPGQMSLSDRLGVIISPQGIVNSSVITSLGLVTLPIYNVQIAEAAGIQESKLQLDYPTSNLFNYIRDLAKDVNLSLGWISTEGVKLDPHLIGAIYRHDMTQIDVIENTALYLNNVFRTNRDNTSAYSLANDMNNELLAHQWADGSAIANIQNIITNSGDFYPSNYAHVASGIFLNTGGFVIIPQTATDVQSALSYIDQNSLTLLGSRVQNLYTNGISVNSRSSSLNFDGYGSAVVPVTPAVTFLRAPSGIASSPVDSIVSPFGDDIIQLLPTSSQQDGYAFDAQFALIRTGDIIRVSYANDGYNIEVQYVISEKKYVDVGGSESYYVRIAGINLMYAANATVRIDRPLFNNNKYGVLSVASGTPIGSNGDSLLGNITPSIIVANPDGAQCTGVGFNPDQFDQNHYLLYLVLYPNGNPLDGYTILPGIDVTGNAGTTPGAYTIDSIVAATNNSFRQPGNNYRFTAFQFQGEFGITLDPYSNSSFSVISANVLSGAYVQGYPATYPNNVIDVFPVNGAPIAPDPLGFGPYGAGLASPPFTTSYDSTQSASGFPTIVFTALQSNNYYVNGAERQSLTSLTYQSQAFQSLDGYGDGYWVGTIAGSPLQPVSVAPGQVQVTYNIPLDLSSAGLKAGKTIVVQPYGTNLGLVNYGRFIIQSVVFMTCADLSPMTQITVFDAVHAIGIIGSNPSIIAPVGSQVSIYFSSDSVSFDNETLNDFAEVVGTFKRHFEIYTDQNGTTYTHERARIPFSGNIVVNSNITLHTTPTLSQLDIVVVSPKLRGYVSSVSSSVTTITLYIISFSIETGIYTGFLFDGAHAETSGNTVEGKIGKITRFYDQTNIDYIDIIFGFNNSTIVNFTNHSIDFQLFPSLASDQEVMIIASCQENNSTNAINQILDLREFGNISTEQLTTSALDFISSGDKLHFNGVIRGFATSVNTVTGVTYGMLSVNGGLALVDGNQVSLNNQVFVIPAISELYNSSLYPINYALCVNSEGELLTIVLTDYDSLLATPNATPRIVTVQNVVSSNTYQIDYGNFSYILNDRKDLTILYIVSSTVTGTGSGATTSLVVRDVRRYINDADSSIPAVVTNDLSQGNFQTITSAINWLLFNGTFQNIMLVKGTHTLNSTDVFPVGLQIIGAGSNATITINNSGNDTINISNITFKNITIVVNSYNAFTLGSNVTFDQCIFIYDSNAASGTPPSGVSYAPADFVNAGVGMIYTSLTSVNNNEQLNNVNITNCTFINVFPDYFPFISIQLTDRGAIAQNINIANNTFLSETPDDLRAIIAFTATEYTLASNNYPLRPKLVNTFIENNICNQSQMILISGQPNADGYMTGTYLTAVNTHISNNTCGTIGYFVAANDTSDSYNDYSLSTPLNVRNQFDNLVISGNTCHLITNLNIAGHYIPFLIFNTNGNNFTETVKVPTGQVDIFSNTVNWISVGTYGPGGIAQVDSGKGVRIANNKLNPGNSGYLISYTAGYPNVNGIVNSNTEYLVIPPNVGINLMLGSIVAISSVDSTQSLISDNILTQNVLYVNNSTNTNITNGSVSNGGLPYFYSFGISAGANALITNNVIDQVVNNADGSIIQVGSTTANLTITNNKLVRGTWKIAAYVGGSTNSIAACVITDNFFDSIYVDNSGTFNDAFTNYPYYPLIWTYVRNKNQVSYVAVPLYEHNSFIYNLFTPDSSITLASLFTFANANTTPLDNTESPLCIRLAKVLPEGCTLLYATLGIYGFEGNYIIPNTSSIFTQININKSNQIITPTTTPTTYTTNLTNGGTFAGSIADVASNQNTSVYHFPANPGSNNISLTSGSVTSPGTPIYDLYNSTVYLNLDMSGATFPMNTSKEYEVILSLNFAQIKTNTDSSSSLGFSPFVLRYVWG